MSDNKDGGLDLYETAWYCGLPWDHPEKLPPREQLTEDILLASLHNCDPKAITKIPRDLLSPGFCVKAVQWDPAALEYLSEECKTYDVYLAAIEKDGNLLAQVPEKHKTRELCRAALVSSKNSPTVLDSFPRSMSQKEIELLYWEVTRERIDKIEYKAARVLALRELQKSTPKHLGITEEAIEAKIAEIRATVEQHYRKHWKEVDPVIQELMEALEAEKMKESLKKGYQVFQEILKQKHKPKDGDGENNS